MDFVSLACEDGCIHSQVLNAKREEIDTPSSEIRKEVDPFSWV